MGPVRHLGKLCSELPILLRWSIYNSASPNLVEFQVLWPCLTPADSCIDTVEQAWARTLIPCQFSTRVPHQHFSSNCQWKSILFMLYNSHCVNLGLPLIPASPLFSSCLLHSQYDVALALHAVSHIDLSSSSLSYLEEQAWSNAGNYKCTRPNNIKNVTSCRDRSANASSIMHRSRGRWLLVTKNGGLCI